MSDTKYLHVGDKKYALETLPEEVKTQLQVLSFARQEVAELETRVGLMNVSIQALETSIGSMLEEVEPAAE